MDREPAPPRPSVEEPAPTGAPLEAMSSPALARALLERMSALAKKEVELARSEAHEDAQHGVTAGGFGGLAAGAAIAVLTCSLLAAIDGLSHFIPFWLAALLLAAGFLVVAAAAGLGAYKEARAARPRRSLREARATMRLFTERFAS